MKGDRTCSFSRLVRIRWSHAPLSLTRLNRFHDLSIVFKPGGGGGRGLDPESFNRSRGEGRRSKGRWSARIQILFVHVESVYRFGRCNDFVPRFCPFVVLVNPNKSRDDRAARPLPGLLLLPSTSPPDFRLLIISGSSCGRFRKSKRRAFNCDRKYCETRQFANFFSLL